MDYETYEPDMADPWYEQMCRAAYTAMFSGGNCERINYDGPALSVLPDTRNVRSNVRRAARKVKSNADIR